MTRCAATNCRKTATRTVVWEQYGKIVDYSHECKAHAIESATVPGSYSSNRSIKATTILSGIRHLDKLLHHTHTE